MSLFVPLLSRVRHDEASFRPLFVGFGQLGYFFRIFVGYIVHFGAVVVEVVEFPLRATAGTHDLPAVAGKERPLVEMLEPEIFVSLTGAFLKDRFKALAFHRYYFIAVVFRWVFGFGKIHAGGHNVHDMSP